MNVLLDVHHPADYHVLKHFRTEMLARGHEVRVSSREKDLTIPLLEADGVPHEMLSRQGSGSLPQLAAEWVVRSYRTMRMASRHKIDVLVGITGPVIAPVGRLIRRPSVVLCDAENATRTHRFVYPLATVIVTGESYTDTVKGRHVTYPGYHQSAYLHPTRFTPDRGVVADAGIDPDQPYSIVRFVSWRSSHDVGEDGLVDSAKVRLIHRLLEIGRVLITSEDELPAGLDQYRISTPPSLIHHLIAFSRIVVGESATMASEAAMLGVPAVYFRETGRGYTDEQEHRYGLVRNLTMDDEAAIIDAVEAMLAIAPDELEARHQRLLDDKIDLTTWLVDFVESRGWETASASVR